MPTLAPTVHERLARCGTRVYVDGLVAGADVVLSVDGVDTAITAMGGAHTFTVPALAAGAVVRARQDAGGGFSPFSPGIVVEDALVPPVAAPLLPAEVVACAHCVHVAGLVPGCDVELFVGKTIVGKGVANGNGGACVQVDLSVLKRPASTLSGRMLVCGQPGPSASTPIVPSPALPRPTVGEPVFGCQRVVPLATLVPGSRVRLESDGGDSLGGFCSCWTSVNVRVVRGLVAGERVRAQAAFEGTGACKATSPWSDWRVVVPPDDGITPEVLPALIEGDQVIRVANQIEGASLTVKIRPDAAQPAEEFGPRPASPFPEIALNAPLVAGNVVSVVQTLCGVSKESEPLTVLPLPPVVHAPAVVPPLYACGAAVQVSGLHPGALVRIFQDGIAIGVRWAGIEPSVSVPAAPPLVAGGQVTATQTVGNVVSPPSDPVVVQSLKALQRPRILQPVALGDTAIWISRITPGAVVRVRSGTTLLGEALASEPVMRIAIAPVPGPVTASVKLCALSQTSLAVTPIDDPDTAGLFPGAGEEFLAFAEWNVPATADGDPFTSPIEGQVYFPATAGGKLHADATNLPLVVIAHGFWPRQYTDQTTGDLLSVESFKGYDYLARHLARWGLLVFSLSLDRVNDLVSSAKPLQYSRAEIVLHAIDSMLAHDRYGRRIDRERVGLIGHSMGGEGVVVAQALNHDEARGYGIRGVVSIAPTRWRPEVVLRGSRYLQLLGSHDQLLQTGAATGTDAHAHFSGFRIYDRAWRPKTHVWIHGARHNPFNRRWLVGGDLIEYGGLPTSLSPGLHERIARGLINAFFQDALRGQAVYAGYLEGTILPRGIAALRIYLQHSGAPDHVVDNFGDGDEQFLLPVQPPGKTTNRKGQAVTAGGAGLVTWQDVDHTALAHSPHSTLGVELSAGAPSVTYVSGTGGLAAGPTEVFALRLAQFHPDATRNPEGEAADLFVTLSGGGQQSTVRLGAVGQVPYPDSAAAVLTVLRTVRLPLDAFLAANPAFNLATIQSVTLDFKARPTAHLLVDDLEFGD